MKKDKLKVYVSFSRECYALNKSEIVDKLNTYHENIEASAYWGGTYDREELLKDVDIVLCVSWDIRGKSPYLYGSRGVYEEAKYAQKQNIQVYCLMDAELNHPDDVFFDYVDVSPYKGGELYNIETWDGDYGKLFVHKGIHQFGTILWDWLAHKNLLNKTIKDDHSYPLTEAECYQPMLATAKLLNLI